MGIQYKTLSRFMQDIPGVVVQKKDRQYYYYVNVVNNGAKDMSHIDSIINSKAAGKHVGDNKTHNNTINNKHNHHTKNNAPNCAIIDDITAQKITKILQDLLKNNKAVSGSVLGKALSAKNIAYSTLHKTLSKIDQIAHKKQDNEYVYWLKNASATADRNTPSAKNIAIIIDVLSDLLAQNTDARGVSGSKLAAALKDKVAYGKLSTFLSHIPQIATKYSGDVNKTPFYHIKGKAIVSA